MRKGKLLMPGRCSVLFGLAAVACALFPGRGAASENKQGGVLKIGLVQSLFRGTVGEKALAQAKPMGDIMAAQSGVRLEFCAVCDHEELARRLQQGEIHLAVMHGIELAWAQKHCKELQPLVLAMNQSYKLKSYILVRQGDPAQSLADLKGRKLAVPAKSLYHNSLYLQKALEEAGQNPAGFFEEKTVTSVHAGVEAVIDGQADVAVIDGVAWENYVENKPARAKRLRVLSESSTFPTAALVYKPGNIPENLEKQLRETLVTLHTRPLGRQMLLLWRLSQFRAVPEEYPGLLVEVVKHYPLPPKPVEFCTSEK